MLEIKTEALYNGTYKQFLLKKLIKIVYLFNKTDGFMFY